MRITRPRLSVRSLMIVVLVLGGGFGWIVHRAHVQRDAVAAIQRAGGRVALSWQWSNGLPVAARPKTPGLDWLRRTIGTDFVDTVTYVHLQGAQCGDEALLAACRLPWLEELEVVDTGVTDAGADEIWRLEHLRQLDFRLNRTTARPLEHISKMSELRVLKLAMKLSPVPIKDADMAFLQRLTKLQRLMLPSTELTDGWLAYLDGLKDLEALELSDMKLTNEGMIHLKGLSKITTLSLQGTGITSLEPLRPLTNLMSLCIAYTAVGDSSLADLQSWPKLYYLDVRKTNVTDDGIAELVRVYPRLRVTR